MKAAILSLITLAALVATTTSADARPPRYRTYYTPGVTVYPSINSSPYANGFGYGYGYYPYYRYPASGFSFNVGGFGLTIGNSYSYPTWYYGSGYYPRPYYGGYSYGNRWWRNW